MFSFRLPEDFVEALGARPVKWGFEVAEGVSLGELTFIRTYSRVREDGTKERWIDVVERVINGMYSIQRDHCTENRLPWSDEQALESAKEAAERLYDLKWTPPGRGLWMMGSPMVMEQRNSAPLQNCAFISTDDWQETPGEWVAWLMEASMLGVGVGLNTAMAKCNIEVHQPTGEAEHIVISDDREGWVDSTARLVNSYLVPGSQPVTFDYSLIRPAGAPIKTFGGTAAGPDPLIKLHTQLHTVLGAAVGSTVDTRLTADIANLVGVAVVAGNVRRSAEVLLGDSDDEVFQSLKDPNAFPERNSFDPENPGWGWMSNNSMYVDVGFDYKKIEDKIALNGEPGLMWLDVIRSNSRIGTSDNRDTLVAGGNPCMEQFLESREMCTLVETYLPRHNSLADFQRTLKYAYLYSKTITLLPTHWKSTNSVMMRNRRIGTSVSGIAEFADKNGLPTLREWLGSGYDTIAGWDSMYSRWLCIRESVRTTTVKPSGTVSLLAGVTPGVHWGPGGKYFLRTIRFSAMDPMVSLLEDAGYRIEDDVVSAGTKVVYFPIRSNQERAERDVSIWEKTHLAALAQREWSDNGVSVTISFDPETEAQHISTVLHQYEGQLKAVSFLPSGNLTYPQMPYTGIDADEYEQAVAQLGPVDLSIIYNGGKALDAAGETGCTTDACEIKFSRLNAKDDK